MGERLKEGGERKEGGKSYNLAESHGGEGNDEEDRGTHVFFSFREWSFGDRRKDVCVYMYKPRVLSYVTRFEYGGQQQVR